MINLSSPTSSLHTQKKSWCVNLPALCCRTSEEASQMQTRSWAARRLVGLKIKRDQEFSSWFESPSSRHERAGHLSIRAVLGGPAVNQGGPVSLTAAVKSSPQVAGVCYRGSTRCLGRRLQSKKIGLTLFACLMVRQQRSLFLPLLPRKINSFKSGIVAPVNPLTSAHVWFYKQMF